MKKSKFYQIKNITEREYTLVDCDGSVITRQIQDVDKSASAFTIQDAKNGDVLCYKDEISLYKHDIKNCTKQETTFGGFVYHCCYDGKRFITDSLYSLTEQDKMDIHPATKEQRDLLFKKMKEAGYTFDFEKKELKKVEKKSQRMISAEAKEAMYDKPTDEDMKEALRTEYEKGRADAFAQMQKEWSEEDEKIRQNIMSLLSDMRRHRIEESTYQKYYPWLKSLKDKVIPQSKQEWSEEDEAVINKVESWLDTLCDYLKDSSSECIPDIKDVINKLNSLRHQKQWKPSDAQIRALEYIINNAHNTSYSCKIAKELLEQLRKLKGE